MPYNGLSPNPYATGIATPKSPAELALERQLNASVLYRGNANNYQPTGTTASTTAPFTTDSNTHSPMSSGGLATTGAPNTSLGTLLTPTATPAVSAQVLPTLRFLLPKGAFLDCTLETAIDSSLDGMITCITATDSFGADGQVVLIERGSKLVGEKRGEVKQGQGRVFVLWNEVRTPTGVVAQLASPGTDELGRSGLPGHVNTHFWQRFGGAILISVIDGAIQGWVNREGSGNDTVVYNPQGSMDVMHEVLRNTIDIPPTVIKNQGDRIQVLVARDVDFRSVYALRNTN
jgi:type IV secretion system protein VirB10